jgi:hypothetical protein
VIERFNFYDVYGYFLPGFALIAMLSSPTLIYQGAWPKDLPSAVGLVIVAYLAGHLLFSVAQGVLPSQIRDAKHPNEYRHRSQILLDWKDLRLSKEIKEELQEIIQHTFKIDLGNSGKHGSGQSEEAKLAPAQHDLKQIDANRNTAFFLCRTVLVNEKCAAYAEQYEGMYVFMRGLCAASVLGAAYFLGWCLAILQSHCSREIFFSVLLLSLLLSALLALVPLRRARPAQEKQKEDPKTSTRKRQRAMRAMAAGIFTSLLCCGFFAGAHHVSSLAQSEAFLLLAIASLFAAFRFYGAYQSFAWEFAIAVWRDFFALEAARSVTTPTPKEQH